MNSSNSPAAMPWFGAAPGPTTSSCSITPLIVPSRSGQVCVPAGAFVIGGLLAHNHTLMPPLVARAPKWMCACVTSVVKPRYDSRHSILSVKRFKRALNSPLAGDESVGTSS
jgi:hypothetical protein